MEDRTTSDSDIEILVHTLLSLEVESYQENGIRHSDLLSQLQGLSENTRQQMLDIVKNRVDQALQESATDDQTLQTLASITEHIDAPYARLLDRQSKCIYAKLLLTGEEDGDVNTTYAARRQAAIDALVCPFEALDRFSDEEAAAIISALEQALI